MWGRTLHHEAHLRTCEVHFKSHLLHPSSWQHRRRRCRATCIKPSHSHSGSKYHVICRKIQQESHQFCLRQVLTW
eukprot:6459071-Amphidinium_carterae.1